MDQHVKSARKPKSVYYIRIHDLSYAGYIRPKIPVRIVVIVVNLTLKSLIEDYYYSHTYTNSFKLTVIIGCRIVKSDF